MLGSGSPCKHTFTDQALAEVLTDDNEYLASLVGSDGACTFLRVIVGSHFSGTNSTPPTPIFLSESQRIADLDNQCLGNRCG
jgi:hypothetical protein